MLSLTAAHRDETCPLTPFPDTKIASIAQASPSILQNLRSTTKTALSFTTRPVDTRDSPSSPSTGELVQGSVEVALAPGTSRFIRTDVLFELHRKLFAAKPSVSDGKDSPGFITGSLCVAYGTTRPLGMLSTETQHLSTANISTSSQTGAVLGVPLSDRFYLGGPLSMRGWQRAGVGPLSMPYRRDDSPTDRPGDALGGLTRLSLVAMLTTPFPILFPSSENLKSFTFMNAGLLLPHSFFPLAPLSATPLRPFLRVSSGVGLSYALGPARLELTYTLPLILAPHDNVKSFQLGLGMSMNTEV
jgi:outer membrane protein assembly factor BamA